MAPGDFRLPFEDDDDNDGGFRSWEAPDLDRFGSCRPSPPFFGPRSFGLSLDISEIDGGSCCPSR